MLGRLVVTASTQHEKICRGHFSYNFLIENETTAPLKTARKRNELVYRDNRNGTQKSGFLTLPRLVSGGRTDFCQNVTAVQGVFFSPNALLTPPEHSVGGQRRFFAPARNAPFKKNLKWSITRGTRQPRFPLKRTNGGFVSLFEKIILI